MGLAAMPSRLWVATRKGLFTLERGHAGWTVSDVNFLGDPVSAVYADPQDETVYAALNLGHFGCKLRRRQVGKGWEEVAVPRYPQQPDGDTDDVRWTLRLIWCLEPTREAPGSLWAGTVPGGLFRSDDRGASWNLVRGLWDRPERRSWRGTGGQGPGLHSICVDPRDPARLLVGVSCGGVWWTGDRGATWAARTAGMYAEYMPNEQEADPVAQDPHRIVRCEGQPNRLFAQHHNGIFRSDDDGLSWTPLHGRPSSFGFAAAVHPRDPDTAFFVPAVKDECRVPVGGALVVSRTRDAGRTFDVLRHGLPQQHAYDVVYRHALAVDIEGQRVALGTTTGSLFVSEDAGAHFAHISAHLPPVNAVRFVGS